MAYSSTTIPSPPSYTWLTTSTTYYLSPTGSDTGRGTIGSPWKNIQRALDALAHVRIAPNATVTISLANGTYENLPSVYIEHPDAHRIVITGQNTYTPNITSIQGAVSGTAPNRSAVLNMSSVSNLEAGDWILIRGCSGGTNPELLNGFYEITNVDVGNTRITVSLKNYHATNPSGSVASTTSVVVKTILKFRGAGDGITIVRGSRLQALNNLGIISNASGISSTVSSVGVRCSGAMSKVTCTNVGVSSFEIGFQSRKQGSLRASSCCASFNTLHGFAAMGGSELVANTSHANGNRGNGYRCEQGAFLTANTSTACGNNSSGYSIANNGTMVAEPAVGSFNTSSGVQAANNAFFRCSTGTLVTNNNGLHGIQATNNSNILLVGTTITANNNTSNGIIAEMGASVISDTNSSHSCNSNSVGIGANYDSEVIAPGGTIDSNTSQGVLCQFHGYAGVASSTITMRANQASAAGTGILSSQSSYINADNASVLYSALAGQADLHGYLRCNGIQCTGNIQCLQATVRSFISCPAGSAQPSFSRTGTPSGTAILAQHYSRIALSSSASYSNYSTNNSPTANTEGNEVGYIDT